MPDDRPELKEAWCELLNRHQWDHAVTLTTRYPFSPQQLGDLIVRFARKLARSAQHRTPWFASFERTHEAGHWHAHVLLGGTDDLEHRKIARAWIHGFTRVQTLEDPRPAVRYAVKHIGSDSDSYALSRRWIPQKTPVPSCVEVSEGGVVGGGDGKRGL